MRKVSTKKLTCGCICFFRAGFQIFLFSLYNGFTMMQQSLYESNNREILFNRFMYSCALSLSIYLFGDLHHFQQCTGHITTGNFVGRRGNQYIQLVKVLYCKLPTIGKQLPTFPHKVRALNRQPQRWECVTIVPPCSL